MNDCEDKRLKLRMIIGLFFLGLLLLAGLEILLIWALNRVAGLPAFHFGWLNALLGLLSVTVGGALVIWSVRIQYTEGKGTPAPIAATQKLIDDGPYAFTRNPMTLGAAVLYLGIAIWYGSSAAIGLVLLVFTALLTYIYFHETKELCQRFGTDYLEYKRKTPFLIPDFRKIGRIGHS